MSRSTWISSLSRTNHLQVSRPKPPSRRQPRKIRRIKSKRPAETTDVANPATKQQPAEDEDAVAQFLMDLKLDEDD